MSVRRFTLPLMSAGALLLFSTVASAGPPPPPPTEGVGTGGPPTSTGVRPPPPSFAPPSSGPSSSPTDPLIDQRTPEKDLSKNWGYANDEAPRPNYVRAEREAALQINPIGYYQGVTIGGENLPPFAPESLGGAAVMTWTGFEGEKGGVGSHVFFQLSSPVSPNMVQQPDIITLRLPNTSVNVKNNMRRLDTTYFKTPVASVTISRDGADTVIKMRLRRPAQATVGTREGANGYKLLVVQFPIDSLAGPAPAPAPTPPAPQS